MVLNTDCEIINKNSVKIKYQTNYVKRLSSSKNVVEHIKSTMTLSMDDNRQLSEAG